MDNRAQQLKSAFRKLKVVRVVFLAFGVLFAIAALALGLTQAINERDPEPAILSSIVACIGLIVGGAGWFFVGHFMRSATNLLVPRYGPQFEEDMTGELRHWEHAVDYREMVWAKADFSIQATAVIVVNGVEHELQFSAANLFTKDDLRGNIDVAVRGVADPETEQFSPEISEHLQLRIPGMETALSCLGHGKQSAEDRSGFVFTYSASDLIEEFGFDRQRWETWLDELPDNLPVIQILWHEYVLCEVPSHVAD